MAQWQAVQGMHEARALYGMHFPLELRHYLSFWIEGMCL
jgi:hypothetical protein